MTRLKDVILGCNPNATGTTGGWNGGPGRVFDVFGEPYGPGNWSLSCNVRVVGPGTIGWIGRSDGDWGDLAGIIGFTGHPSRHSDREVYCEGILFALPFEWWIPGKDINAAGWSNRAPWGDTTPRRCRSGEELAAPDVAVLERLLHPVARHEVRDFRGLWTP